MAKEQYDPEIHITAAEFRRLGAGLSDDVPDCAYIRRDSLRFEMGKAHPEEGTRQLSVDIVVSSVEPFEWVTVTGIIEV